MTVSIIVPAYNCEPYLAAALQSIQNQTYFDLEIIVVDDGSTDDTLNIARQIASDDARVRVITQANSGKPAATRNAGLRIATGEFVAFLDGDDVYLPEKIERELAVLQAQPDVDIVFCDVVQFQSDWQRPDNECYLRDLDFVRIAAQYLEKVADETYLCSADFYVFMSTNFSCLCTPSVLIRRRVLQGECAQFTETLRIGEDIDLWFQLARRVRIAYLDRPLTAYRHHGSSITKNEEVSLRDTIEAHRRNLERGREVFSAEQIAVLNHKMARRYFSLAYLRFRQGNPVEARTLYERARGYDPAVFSRVAWLKTWLPAVVVRRLGSHR